MKTKILSFFLFLITLSGFSQNEGFNLGAGGLLSTSNYYQGGAYVEANYSWKLGDKFYLGPITSLQYYISKGKDYVYDNNGLIVTQEVGNVFIGPVAAAVRYELTDNFVIGGDVGFVSIFIGSLNNVSDGGFYAAPRIQYQISEKFGITTGYRIIGDVIDTLGSVNFGLEFNL